MPYEVHRVYNVLILKSVAWLTISNFVWQMTSIFQTNTLTCIKNIEMSNIVIRTA